MVKLDARNREEVKSIILICRARGFNPRQTTKVVNDHLYAMHIPKTLSQSYIQKIIETTRHEAGAWLKDLTHGKYEYIDMFKTIIERLTTEQNELWELIDKRKEDPRKDYLLVKAYAEVHSINRTLWEFYKDIPLLMPSTTSKTLDGIVFEDTTSVFPKLSAQ